MNEQSQVKEEISLGELFLFIKKAFHILRRRVLLLTTFGVIGALLGLLFAYFQKPKYTAECSFVLDEDKGGGLSAYSGLASMVGIDLGGGGGLFQGDNILELYQSRRMITETLLSEGNFNGQKKLLIDHFLLSNNYRKRWESDSSLKTLNFQIPQNKFSLKHDSILTLVAESIKKNSLSVSKPDKKLSIIKVSATSTDQLFAKIFTERLVENVNTFYIRTKTKKSIQNLQILQHQTDSVRNALNSAISGVAISVDLNPNQNPARQVLRVPSQRRTIDAETNKAILTELVKNLEISRVALRKETPLIQVIDFPILPLKKTKVSKMVSAGVGGVLMLLFCTCYLVVTNKKASQNETTI